jgi:hypothetical protein
LAVGNVGKLTQQITLEFGCCQSRNERASQDIGKKTASQVTALAAWQQQDKR